MAAVAGLPHAYGNDKDPGGLIEYSRKYYPVKQRAKVPSISELKAELPGLKAKNDYLHYGKNAQIILLLETAKAKEANPNLSITEGNELQRKIAYKYLKEYPALRQNFVYMNTLRLIELAQGNKKEYDELYDVITTAHASKLDTDLPCYEFIHKAFDPKRNMAEQKAAYERCQDSKSIMYFKIDAGNKYKCLKVHGKPFNDLYDFQKLYHTSKC